MFKIYALQLVDSKYYIGKTNKTVSERFTEHITKSEVSWTSLYKPEIILEAYESSNPFGEDNLTKKYMFDYGIENVRGGSYTKIILDDWQLKALEHEFLSIGDKCFKCKKLGHIARYCTNSLCDPLDTYLSAFNTSDEINDEVIKLEDAKKNIIQLNLTINQLSKLNLDIKYLDELMHLQKLNIDASLIQMYLRNPQIANFDTNTHSPLRASIRGSDNLEKILKLAQFSKECLELYLIYFYNGLGHNQITNSNNINPIHTILKEIKQLKEAEYKLDIIIKQYGSQKVIDDKITKLLFKQITIYDK